jgi:UDP-2-acetamido-2,6-beta-L-arabino-hexul-4-ose reductase
MSETNWKGAKGMKFLITGAAGFIGRNLCAPPQGCGDIRSFWNTAAPPDGSFLRYARSAVYSPRPPVNRPADPDTFDENRSFTAELLDCLHEAKNAAPVLYASSAQAALDNAYGRSKLQAEELVFAYGAQMGADVYVYRLPGVFGKWCRPNYNRVVATFCDAAAHGRPLCVLDADAPITLAHIDDATGEMIRALEGHANRQGAFCALSSTFLTTVGDIARRIVSFRTGRPDCAVPDMDDPLTMRLYSNISELPAGRRLRLPVDAARGRQGAVCGIPEIFVGGQVSVNISRPV